MTLPVDRIRAAVLESLTNREQNACIVYLATSPVAKGEALIAPRLEFACPTDSYLIFVDLDPSANWGHSCCYMCVDQETLRSYRVDAEFPPFGPANTCRREWRVIYRSPEIPGGFSNVSER